ncbi:hypothetical protein L0U85_17725 [Glycomyces sp. L485]|uniref:hypothetical protein n=1 Tax=Glycomyces sp. L485 TaxID=2909235 RepID=UPI001F4B4D50|nr:hypothetical protein [Glycomyces sp. L485]MCH7232676.1 hypothetical protein [Glycomyces sp. L485]
MPRTLTGRAHTPLSCPGTVVYDSSGAPALVYSFIAQFEGHEDNYGATHPVVEAHARTGRAIPAIVDEAEPTTPDAIEFDVEDVLSGADQ